MKRLLLTTVSALVLTTAPVLAETAADVNATATVKTDTESALDKVGNSIEQGWNKTSKAVSETAEDVAEGTKKVYEDVREDIASTEIKIIPQADTTFAHDRLASTLIGATLYSDKGDKVGKIEDITVDAQGHTRTIIVGDGTFFGLGKKVALNHDQFALDASSQKLVSPLTKEQLESSDDFNYDNLAGYRVSTLLDGQIVDVNNKTVGQVEDIAFTNGQADKILLSYNQILGVSGDRAIMDFNLPKLVINGEQNVDFQITPAQVSELEQLGKSHAN